MCYNVRPYPDHAVSWHQSVESLHSWMTSVDTDPDITHCFINSLHSQGLSFFTSHDRPSCHTAATAQATIGFFYTLMGCLLAHWEMIQSLYWSNKQCTRSACHWAHNFCLQLLHLTHSTWTSHNHLLQEHLVQAQRSSAKATIHQEFELGLQHLLPFNQFYVRQSSPTDGFSLELVLTLSLADQQLWIHSVQAARSHGSQITSLELIQMQSFFHQWLHPESINVHTS